MRSKLLHDGAQRTWALVFETGDEVAGTLRAFAAEHGLAGSHFTAIGAFQDVTVAYFDWESKEYQPIPIREQVEVLMLAGDIALKDGEPKLHAHVTVAKRDGTAHGGHLVEAHVRPTLELVLTESPEHLQRRHDAETGLALIEV
ncbi:MAG TPA: PPC domain-containing DNA-binding protein [Longimicrobiaceae bacterium]|nr:PPC domain-containing DNA-binding protein [Longimicrobiaceae bacterium]